MAHLCRIMNIATFRLNRPKGWFSENLLFWNVQIKQDIVCVLCLFVLALTVLRLVLGVWEDHPQLVSDQHIYWPADCINLWQGGIQPLSPAAVWGVQGEVLQGLHQQPGGGGQVRPQLSLFLLILLILSLFILILLILTLLILIL